MGEVKLMRRLIGVHQKLSLTRRLTWRLPPDEAVPPGPKRKKLDALVDCRKNGEVMFPTGVPLFV